MEGTLWKWTNYWSGWQPRWFILEDGVLSYYKSEEEVCQGCKGSIKMSVCEIIVHPTDAARLDLVIPSEQHFYVKAATPQERQQWLVSLGTAKANLSAQQKKDSAVTSNPDILKTKKSELRLYCDLLMQQVHAVKSVATSVNGHPNMETLNEATSLLGPTCDTFIKTLEECMKLANANFSYEIPHHHIKDTAVSPALPTNNFRKISKLHDHRSNSADRKLDPGENSKVARLQNGFEIIVRNDVHNGSKLEDISEDVNRKPSFEENVSVVTEKSEISTAEMSSASTENENDDYYSSDESNAAQNEEAEEKAPKKDVQNFFSNIEISFLNLRLTDNDGIPSDHFIKSCSVVLDIFDLFRSPIFTPLRMDVQGNIKKLNSKFQKDPGRFVTLQDIVKYEMETNTTTVRNSATDALLWLKRGLEFVQEFLLEFTTGHDLSTCVFNAYGKTLKQYHGWIVRNIIMAAAHKVPSRQETLTALALRPEDVRHPLYEKTLMEEAKLFIKSMTLLTSVLNEFYYRHKLDKKEIV